MAVKKVLTLFLLLAAIVTSFAQQRKVTLIDKTTDEPVPFASVEIIPIDERTESVSAVTDVFGVAVVPLQSKVIVRVRHLSYFEKKDTLPEGVSKTIYLEPALKEMPGFVVTAQSRPTDPKNSVYPVKVISAESIENRGANNLRDVLTQQLNVRVNQDNVLGSGITLQGLGGQQVKYLVDGIPVIGRLNGDIDVSQLNLNEAKRIEIIEGPVSVLYGSNALGGVINIITRKDQVNLWEADINTYYESVGQYNVDGRIGFYKKGHFLSLSGGRYYFDGFTTNDSLRNMPWDPKDQYFGAIKYGYRFKTFRLLYTGNYYRETITNRGNLRSPLYINAFDDYYRITRLTESISFNGDLKKDHYINTTAAYTYFNRRKNTYWKDMLTLEETPVASTDAHDTTTNHALFARGYISRNRASSWFNYTFGYDINWEQGSGGRIETGQQAIGDYALFASLTFSPGTQWTIQPGIRAAYNSAYDAPVTPSLHIKFRPVEPLNIRVSYARGFRAPSIKELYFDFQDVNHNITGNPNLEAEHSHHFQLQLAYDKVIQKTHVTVTPSAFFNKVTNSIELVQDYSQPISGTLPFSYQNFSQTRVAGGQLTLKFVFDNNLEVSLGTSVTGRDYEFNDTIQSDNFEWYPEIAASASYTIPKAKIRVSLFNKFNGAFTTPYVDQDNQVSLQRIEAFNLMDLSLSRNFFNNRITLVLGAKNLLNINSVGASGQGNNFHSASLEAVSVAWGRTFFATLRFSFEKRGS